MTAQEIISSGNLELYVSGALSEAEHDEIKIASQKFPEVKHEIEVIEISLMRLAEAAAPPLSDRIWQQILLHIRSDKTSQEPKGSNWIGILGWAAAIAAIAGIFWMMNQNQDLEDQLQIVQSQNSELEQLINSSEEELAEAEKVLEILRAQDYATFVLPGNQAVAPQAYAKIYYDKKDAVAYIDTNGLPESPREKVFQVWSLIMEPLTPRSMGLIEKRNEIAAGIYRFDNVPDPEAIGITLEPAGGSDTPTLSQLYILGQVGQ
ncbi:MAG: anti-sigma factor [Flavobacteriaceae bacterium]|nr:anti-sigma factor [Flavobacteriaceae bacterium]